MTRQQANDDDEIVNGPTLAARLGLTPTAVSKLAGDGVLIRTGRGKYRAWASVLSYVERLRRSASGRGSPTAAARTRLIEAQAARAEHRLEVDRGEMVPLYEVEAEWSGILRTVRSGVLAVTSRAAIRLPNLSREYLAILDEELRQVLRELSEDKQGTESIEESPKVASTNRRKTVK